MQRRGGYPPIKNVCLQICVSVVRINSEDFGRYVFSDTAKTFLSFEKRVNFGRCPSPPLKHKCHIQYLYPQAQALKINILSINKFE